MELALNNDFLEKIHFKKIQEITKYVGLFLLTVIFILCAYTKLTDIVLVLSIIVVLILCFQNVEDIICMKIILLPFNTLLSENFYTVYLIFSVIILLLLFAKYTLDIISKRKKISYLVLGLLIIYLVYCGLPIFNKIVGIKFFSSISSILSIAFVYEYRENLHLKKLAICFSVSLLLACVLSIFLNYVSAWRDFLDYVGYVDMDNWGEINEVLGKHNCDLIPKFTAFYIHQNILVGFSCFSISMLCYLQYKNQIDDLLFYLLFVPTFIFGYLTVSRAYIVVLFVILLTYFIFLIIRDKKESLKTIIPICLIMIITVGILYKITQFYFTRFESNYEFGVDNSDITEEEWALIMNGELHYDCGRISLYKLYFKFLLNNPLVIIFGRGNDFPWLGKTQSHNFIVDLIYRNGIVGILIYLVMLFFMFDLKNVKKYWNMDRFSIVIILFGWVMFELLNTYFSFLWLAIFIVTFYDKSLYKTKQDIENTESIDVREIDEGIKGNQTIDKKQEITQK